MKKKTILTTITVLVIGMLTGCTAGPTEPQAVNLSPPENAEAPTPARTAPHLPQAILPNGARLNLELAITRDEITQGLMFRTSLASDRGMLFIFPQEHVPSFWMKNTLIPLDMIFLDRHGVVVDVIADAQPCQVDPCPQYIPKAAAMAVLEVAAGVSAKLGISDGLEMKFTRVPDYPVADDEAATNR